MATMANPFPEPVRGNPLNLTLEKGRGNIIDQLLIITWIIVLPLDFPMAGPLRYPVALLVILAAAIHYRQVLPAVVRGGIFFLVPAFSLLSVLWADFPFHALRVGILSGVGLIVAAFTASRLDHRQLVVCVFVGVGLLCLASLANLRMTLVGGIDGGWAVIGVFPHKNVLGNRMVLLIAAAMAIILDKRYSGHWRIAAAIMLVPAWYLIFRSNSATALLLGVGVTGLLAALGGLWRPGARIRGMRPILAILGIMVIGGGGLWLTNVARVDLYAETLENFGKDRSLTGRTDIWAVGMDQIEERPLLGVGAGSFWRPGVSEATQISTRFGAENNQFYFHNVFIEVMVHVGIVGLVIYIAVSGIAFWVLFSDWWRNQRELDAFFVAVASMLLLRMMTESEMFMVFLLNPLIFWVGVFIALNRPGPAGRLT